MSFHLRHKALLRTIVLVLPPLLVLVVLHPRLLAATEPPAVPVYANPTDVQPADVVVTAGDQVIWHNQTSVPITISDQPFIVEQPFRLSFPLLRQPPGSGGTAQQAAVTPHWSSGPVQPGEPYSRMYTATGEHPFYVSHAPSFKGTVRVLAPNTAPAIPHSPSPADGALDVSVRPVLTWQDGDANASGTTYTVRYDKRNPPVQVVTDHAYNSFSPGRLEAYTTYYWQVVARNSQGLSSTGPIWRFTTGEAPPALFADLVVGGGIHSCALSVAGEVLCWGANGHGQLGDGTTAQHSTPVAVTGLNSGVSRLATGDYHSCALTEQGAVFCWGWNEEGQLGDGTTTERTTPVAVKGLTSGVTDLTAGDYHTCALTAQGGVVCWGSNDRSQLGDGTTSERTTPVPVTGLPDGVTALAAGQHHTCALTEAGAVLCWGGNGRGQLGDGTKMQRSAPVPVQGLGSGVRAVVAGGTHTCALTNAGAVICWGWNEYGQLGDGTKEDRQIPVVALNPGSGVTALSPGDYHTCALGGNGSVLCWGSNYDYQLGDGTATQRGTPAVVAGLSSGATSLATGDYHTCVLTIWSEVLCWGGNDFGQLGDGTVTSRSTPIGVIVPAQ